MKLGIPNSEVEKEKVKPRRRLSVKQDGLYWREWGAAKKVLRQHMSAQDADAERELITVDTLGANIPHATFSQRQLDDMLDAFRRISAPGTQSAGSGTRRRLLAGIERLGDGYAANVCEDVYGQRDWRGLSEGDLIKLRSTMERRLVRRKRPEPVGITPDGTLVAGTEVQP